MPPPSPSWIDTVLPCAALLVFLALLTVGESAPTPPPPSVHASNADLCQLVDAVTSGQATFLNVGGDVGSGGPRSIDLDAVCDATTPRRCDPVVVAHVAQRLLAAYAADATDISQTMLTLATTSAATSRAMAASLSTFSEAATAAASLAAVLRGQHRGLMGAVGAFAKQALQTTSLSSTAIPTLRTFPAAAVMLLHRAHDTWAAAVANVDAAAAAARASVDKPALLACNGLARRLRVHGGGDDFRYVSETLRTVLDAGVAWAQDA